jgi:alpha-galactosidase
MIVDLTSVDFLASHGMNVLIAAHRLCQRFADEVGIALNLTKTTDRRASLAGADFVINTALVSGHRAMKEGWAIAKKHGYRFGGSYHIVHDEAFWINYYQYACGKHSAT